MKTFWADAWKNGGNWSRWKSRVNGDVPPCFLWHTDTDELVPVENSLLFAMALKAHHLPMELHIYPRGGHGLSLGNEMTRCERYANEPVVQNWIEMAARFGDDGLY